MPPPLGGQRGGGKAAWWALAISTGVLLLGCEYVVLRRWKLAHTEKLRAQARLRATGASFPDGVGGAADLAGVKERHEQKQALLQSVPAAPAVAPGGQVVAAVERGGGRIEPEWDRVTRPFKLDPKLHKFVMYTYEKDKAKSYENVQRAAGGEGGGEGGAEDGGKEEEKEGGGGKHAISHLEGEHGGEWDWCVHVGFHGLLFDWGFSRFVAFHLKPKSALEFGCGIGLYVDYLTRYEEANMTHAIGIEPNPMSAAGLFGRKHPRASIAPIGLAMNVAEQPDDVLDSLGTFDVVYTLEVMEHIPPQFHDRIASFLARRTGKYLLFSAAQKGQHGRGHIPESSHTPDEWIKVFQSKGLFYLPSLSEKLKAAAYAIWSHRENVFMMGTSLDLDSDAPVDKRVHWNRKQVAHRVLFPVLQAGSERVAKTQNCDDFPINTASEPFDMKQVMS